MTSSTVDSLATLTLRCDVCDKPVTGGQGYICVDDGAARERIRAVEEFEKRLHDEQGDHGGRRFRLVPFSELVDDAWVPWHIYHHKCDPHPDSDDYWLPVSDANTYQALLHSSARLLSKTWLQHTNWDEFIYHVFRMNGD